MSTPSKKPLQPLDFDKTKGKPSYQVYRQGFLLKPITGVRKRLVRYWFVLFEQKELLAFLYFADEDHYLEKKKNEGFIRIDDATSIDVVPEYMGRKNAFCITTPRNKFYLVSESRYELHHWLLALHEAMEGYKQHTLQKKKKSTTRPRSSSTSGGPNNTSAKTPPSIKPSRPAPRPPPMSHSKKKENEPPLHNVTTGDDSIQQQLQQVSPIHEPTSPTTSPLDAIVAGLLAETHQMGGVDYNMTEEENPVGEDIEDRTTPPNIGEIRASSTSMPALNSSKEGTESPHGSSSNSQDNEALFTASYDERNTLPMDGPSQKRSIKKRNSTKGFRSVSPPNLPPPPPPPPEEITELENDDNYLQAMNSLKDFGDVLNEITAEMTNKQQTRTDSIKPMPPVRTSSLSPGRKHKIFTEDKEAADQEGDNSVKNYLDEAFEQEDNVGLSTDDEELKSPTEIHHVPTKYPPTSPGILRKEEDKSLTSTNANKRSVMFEDDERINKRSNPSYEPRIDKETNRPLSVAEAKMKLFGDRETKVARYRRSNNFEDEKQIESSTTPITDLEQQETTPTSQTVVIESTDQGQEKEEEKDELVQYIETALQSTSYMETPPQTQDGPAQNEVVRNKGFVTMVGGSQEEGEANMEPVHYTISANNEHDDNISPVEISDNNDDVIINGTEPHPSQPIWSSNGAPPSFNNNSQNPVYRSLV